MAGAARVVTRSGSGFTLHLGKDEDRLYLELRDNGIGFDPSEEFAESRGLQKMRANAARLNAANVEFRQGDWFACLRGERFDLIASNPPYIEAGDPHLDDLRHEPAADPDQGRYFDEPGQEEDRDQGDHAGRREQRQVGTQDARDRTTCADGRNRRGGVRP